MIGKTINLAFHKVGHIASTLCEVVCLKRGKKSPPNFQHHMIFYPGATATGGITCKSTLRPLEKINKKKNNTHQIASENHRTKKLQGPSKVLHGLKVISIKPHLVC